MTIAEEEQPLRKPGHKTLALSLIATAVCGLGCNILSLFCLIPGLVCAVTVSYCFY